MIFKNRDCNISISVYQYIRLKEYQELHYGFFSKTPNGKRKKPVGFASSPRFGVALAQDLTRQIFKEKRMAHLTESIVHYNKLSITKWNGVQERYKVNQSTRFTTNEKMLNFTWHFTRELRELRYSLAGHEDQDWEGFKWAEKEWRSIRKDLKQDVVLWVAKACHTKKFQPGKVQPNIRIPKTVSLLVYVPKEQQVIQMLRMEEWQREFEFYSVNHKTYNMISTWKNPLTSVNGSTAPGGW